MITTKTTTRTTTTTTNKLQKQRLDRLIKIDLEKFLTKGRVLNYLKTHPKRRFRRGSPGCCPMALLLQERFELPNLAMYGSGVAINLARICLPPWARKFMLWYDLDAPIQANSTGQKIYIAMKAAIAKGDL